MKVIDYVYKNVEKYPLLYLTNNYESSKHRIMHHVFLVNGNGIEWAYTKNPDEGGYPVEPLYTKDKYDEYERIYDSPYATDVVDKKEWNLIIKLGLSQIETLFEDSSDPKKLASDSFKQNNKVREEPYPVYDRGWLFYDIECGKLKVSDIKQDWLHEMIAMTEWAHAFYDNKEKFYNSDYYGGNVSRLKSHIKSKSKTWSEILEEYKLSEHNIEQNDYKTLSRQLSEQSRLEYVNLTKNALNKLKNK